MKTVVVDVMNDADFALVMGGGAVAGVFLTLIAQRVVRDVRNLRQLRRLAAVYAAVYNDVTGDRPSPEVRVR